MRWVLALVLGSILLGHFFYVTRDRAEPSQGWAAYEFEAPRESRISRYISAKEHWLGLSYGLAGTFAAWCFGRILRLRRAVLATFAGGLTLSGVLWAGVCFLTGCCGSPMLPLYLGLFGPKFANVTKPLTLGVTLLSIAVGYAWMLKRAPKAIRKNVNARLHENAGAEPGKV